MKKFKAFYYIPKLDKEYSCDVYAMTLEQAYSMYKSDFMILLKIERGRI